MEPDFDALWQLVRERLDAGGSFALRCEKVAEAAGVAKVSKEDLTAAAAKAGDLKMEFRHQFSADSWELYFWR